MSTRAIHELIERVKREWPDAGGMADRALLAVDAIERAACDFTESDAMDEVAIDTVTTFERIQREVLARTLARGTP